MVIYHIDMVILDIDMGYGLMIWQMTVSMWEIIISMWDILSLWRWPSPGVEGMLVSKELEMSTGNTC
jgi:hypothetical protein